MKKLLLSCLISCCVLSFGAVASSPTESGYYTFSVAPQFERRMMFTIWQPIVDDLQRRTGLRFELVTSLSVDEYDSDAKIGRYDFIYVNPYMVPLIDTQPGYQPLVRDSVPLRGILVVRKDSLLQRVEDLRDKSLAVPSMQAFGASLLMRAELDRDYGVKTRPVIARTHASVFLHVVNGLTDAGGSVQNAYDKQDKSIRDSLKVLHLTREVPSHPVAAHPRVPVKVREQVRQAFLDMSADPHGQSLLAKVPMLEAVAAHAEDYQILKTLNLDSYLEQ